MLKVLNINQIRSYQIAEFLYQFENGALPTSFANYFSKTSDTHNYNTRGASCYRPIKARTNLRSFSIKSTGPKVWNSIPPHIQKENKIQPVKTKFFTIIHLESYNAPYETVTS